MHSTTKITKLESRLVRCQTNLKRLNKQRQDTLQDCYRLEGEIQRERLRQYLNGSVKRRFRSADDPELNDATGILTSVRRTRCTVDFGELGTWDMPIDRVIPAEDEQGYTIEMMGAAK